MSAQQMLEKETCTVCGHTTFKYLASVKCEHSPEEWAKAVVGRVALAMKSAREQALLPPQGSGESG